MQHVIIIGAGEVGQHIATRLSEDGHRVVVIDADERRVQRIQSELDVLAVCGNGASPRLLADVGAAKADLLLGVTQSDEANIISTLAGHQLGAARTVARVRDAEFFGDDSFARERLGIDYVINPEEVTAEDVADAISLPGAVAVEFYADDRVAVAEVALGPRSPLLGVAVGDRRRVRPHFIVGTVTGGQARLTAAQDRLCPGDRVLVAAHRRDIAPVVAELSGQAETVHDVIIYGGGRVGAPLARRLEDKFGVTVFEGDETRARKLAESLRRATVLHEESLSKEVFLAHGVDSAQAFVACSADDRQNLLAARYAKELGAHLCLSVVSREEFMPLVDGLGIDAAFSPRLVTADAILRFVRGEQVRAMHLLFSGAEVLEVVVDAGSFMDGRAVGHQRLPDGVQIAALVRGDRVVFPREGREIVRAGDLVVLLGIGEACRDIEQLFDA